MASSTRTLWMTIAAATGTLVVAIALVAGPSIVACASSPQGLLACLRGEVVEAGLLPEPDPAPARPISTAEGPEVTLPVTEEEPVRPAGPAPEPEPAPEPAPVPASPPAAESEPTTEPAPESAPAPEPPPTAGQETAPEAVEAPVTDTPAPVPGGGIAAPMPDPSSESASPPETSPATEPEPAPTPVPERAPTPSPAPAPAPEPALSQPAPAPAVPEAPAPQEIVTADVPLEIEVTGSGELLGTETGAAGGETIVVLPHGLEAAASSSGGAAASGAVTLVLPELAPAPPTETARPAAPAQPVLPVQPVQPAQPAKPLQSAETPALPAAREPMPAPDVATTPVPSAPVAIDAVEIEGTANYFAGVGPEGAEVRLFVRDRFIGATKVEGGRWLVEAEGTLTLPSQRVRVELVSPRGGSAARSEVDLVIDMPRTVVSAPGAEGILAPHQALEGDLRVQLQPESEDEEVPAVPILRVVEVDDPAMLRFASGKAIIRRGETLWTIARRVYGAGKHYERIYQANRGQIANPSRIYPGQVFDLPELEEDRAN